MTPTIEHLIEQLQRAGQLSATDWTKLERAAAALRTADASEIESVVSAIAGLPLDQSDLEPHLAAILNQIVAGVRLRQKEPVARSISADLRSHIHHMYNELRQSSHIRWTLLSWLALARQTDDLTLLADLLATDPPDDSTQLAVALSPLFQHRDYDTSAIFPRLFDALPHKHLASGILDLANYLARQQIVPTHPAAPIRRELASLLGSLVQQLALIEENPNAAAQDAQSLAAIIDDSLPLAVSLCDSLALIGDKDAIGKLYQALELRHRRLQTEAAAALARLGEKAGEDALVALAAEPVARLRVLAYADELGIADRIYPLHATHSARAESQLALWLAQPTQLGIPPTSFELLDEREQNWPGFDEPVWCFLFRFNYNLGGGTYSNIGIAGPLEHTFAADLADLPPDDIYAAFAGWQAEHDDIREYDMARLKPRSAAELARLKRQLAAEGISIVGDELLASFFAERVLSARAVRNGQSGIGVAASSGVTEWFPARSSSRPLGPREAYAIFIGRWMLKAFNP